MRNIKTVMSVLFASIAMLWAIQGTSPAGTDVRTGQEEEPTYTMTIGPDVREPLALSPQNAREHRVVMLQHLEAVQAIIAALVEEDFERAQGIARANLGFVKHREAMAKQHPSEYPPAYHDYATAHHEAAEELARVLPSRDLKQIMPHLNGLLRACVACHSEYKVPGRADK